jgi:hypothetical protein
VRLASFILFERYRTLPVVGLRESCSCERARLQAADIPARPTWNFTARARPRSVFLIRPKVASRSLPLEGAKERAVERTYCERRSASVLRTDVRGSGHARANALGRARPLARSPAMAAPAPASPGAGLGVCGTLLPRLESRLRSESEKADGAGESE